MNEAENTFRTLKEQTPLIKSIWCYIGLHRWTMWGKPISRTEGGYNIDLQTRTCSSCNQVGIKVLRRAYR